MKFTYRWRRVAVTAGQILPDGGVYAWYWVLRAEPASVDQAAAAEAEPRIHGDDDEETSAANDVAIVSSHSQARAFVRSAAQTSYSTDPASWRPSSTGTPAFSVAQWCSGSALGMRTRRPLFESRVAPLFHWVATLGKLFTHIASPVSQLQETGVQKGVFGP